MKIIVLIPTYNESKEIGNVIKAVRKFGLDCLVVDDGSKDNTVQTAEAAGAIVVKNETNMGKGAALAKGFKYSIDNGYSAVLTMDGDGQHLPDDIPSFLNALGISDCGIVIGNRMSSASNMPPVRLATNKVMSWLISKIAKQKIPDTQCGFRLIKTDLLKSLKLKTNKYETESEILIEASRLGFKILSVPVKSVYRGEKSQINPVFDTIRFFRFIWKELWITKEKEG